ncbi:ABC transporter ATP-binding protein [Georgenia yuyongxinii]|uniref:ATP-binding cassette domain-containing protein n=1 Tax=Georgenia yuyongxinii TaxID=2589797 RepID=A0A552WXQ6_9MICO|nr:ATP-binding cassette domain-containing protein [Georgenia yuyongxinii]TRW47621.1 ATP-binding cassette domain-containing protein [Georgenia yuyongxinii]
MPPTLRLIDVTLTYNPGRADEVRALRGVNLDVDQGEFITVVGSNGAGKSSTVQVIAGDVRPSTGEVRMNGRVVNAWPEHKRAGLVARVFDDPRVGSAPDLSVEDNLALALARGRRRTLRFALDQKRRRHLREKLSELGLGLEDRLHQRVGLLSAGQRQSLTMVMAGLASPRILLLDEHLAALDPATAQRVLTVTSTLVREMECATLMVTHNMDHAISIGTRLLVMSGGVIISDIAEQEKQDLTVKGLIDRITRAGGTVADRTLLAQ